MDEYNKGWYLVYTKARHEAIATLNLQRQGFHTYFPLLQQHKRRRNIYQVVTEPLFPHYIFIHLSVEVNDWSKIRSTRGCVSLVRFGSFPARVPDTLVEQIKKEEALRFSEGCQATNFPYFEPGDHVRVVDGILSDYEGIVGTRNNRDRITLLLTITENHTRYVNLFVNQVEKIN
jgi:transcriptional antiterminator RfaH